MPSNTRMRSGRSASSSARAFADAELAHLVEREEHAERLALELGHLQLGQAMPAEELDLGDLPAARGSLRRRGCLPRRGPPGAGRARTRVPGLRSRRAPVSGEAARLVAAAAQRHRVQHVDPADEVGDERRGRLLVDLARRADLLERALVHHHDAVGHRQRLFLVVRDHDGRDADPLLQAADLAAQAHALQRVERRQRLVQQQQARRRRQRAGERDALLLAAGELARVLRLAAGQADQLEQLRDPCLDVLRAGCGG